MVSRKGLEARRSNKDQRLNKLVSSTFQGYPGLPKEPPISYNVLPILCSWQHHHPQLPLSLSGTTRLSRTRPAIANNIYYINHCSCHKPPIWALLRVSFSPQRHPHVTCISTAYRRDPLDAAVTLCQRRVDGLLPRRRRTDLGDWDGGRLRILLACQ